MIRNASSPVLLLCLLFVGLLSTCKKDKDPLPTSITISNLQVINDPSGFAPLTAKIVFTTDRDVSVQMRILGKNGAASDIVHTFPDRTRSFDLLVMGLYADYKNQVELSFLAENGEVLDTEIIDIQTTALHEDLPEIEINERNSNNLADGLIFVNYFGYRFQAFPQKAFMFDDFGDIRWYLDYNDHPFLSNLFYDNGMNQLQNGNLTFGDRNTGQLYEINLLGEVVNTWQLFGLGYHHTLIEKPNGNFLVTVNDYSKPTEEDVIIEINRSSGNIVNRWDLDQSLDKNRKVWESNRANLAIDWFHANGLAYSAADDCIIVSGRTQGVVKLTKDNEVVWILAPHKDWSTAGNGQDLNQFLLQPLDKGGNQITDQLVREGDINHPDFEWNWYQHSPRLLSNGHLMVFDNGENRNFTGNQLYSRAVAFEIDENANTVKQVWSYGKERGGVTYSQVVSSVDWEAEVNHVLFSPGAIINSTTGSGKVIEVDKSSGNLLFEATITPPLTFAAITFHNVHRQSLYGE